MTDDRIEGGLKKGVGKVEDAWGGLTGDAGTQAKGKGNEAAGSIQDVVGQAKDKAQEFVGQARERTQDVVGQAKGKAQDVYGDVESYAREQPLTALGVTLGLGIVIGLILRGGGKTVYVRR